MSKYKLSQFEFIEISNKIHNNMYNYEKVVYSGTLNKVIITCPIHGDFLQQAYSHMKGIGCKYCSNEKKQYNKMSLQEFINKCKIKHGDTYNYDKVDYINSNSKIIITCNFHGDFTQRASAHLHDTQGCPKCFYKKQSIEKSSNIIDFIKKANTIHNYKYDYTKSEYQNSFIKIKITCPLHGEFFQTPAAHLNKQGCKKCGTISLSLKLKNDPQKFINIANTVHNFKYDYSTIKYINCHTKISIICPLHGEFFQEPQSHLNGKGCKKCSSPKGELIILKYLEDNNIPYIPQYTHDLCRNPNTKRKLSFDFYLPTYNICIEFDGLQHYKPFAFGSDRSESTMIKNLKTTQEKDEIRNIFCKNNNIHLLRIPYWEMNNIPNILMNNIKLPQ